MRCRTVDSGVEKPRIAGDNRPQPVGRRWTTFCTPCGSFRRPQSVEIVRPRIHNRLTWSDALSAAHPVDTIWTTSQSPGCGRKKVPKSVEGGRNQGAYSNNGWSSGVGGATPGAAGRGVRGPDEGGTRALRRRVREAEAAFGGVPGWRRHVPDRLWARARTTSDAAGTPSEAYWNDERRPRERVPGRLQRRTAAAVSRS